MSCPGRVGWRLGRSFAREQARILELLIEHVAYDGQQGNVSITFRPTGIRALAGELEECEEFAA